MANWIDKEVSFFNSLKDVEKPTNGKIGTILFSPKLAREHAPLIERIRHTADKAARTEFKKQLPTFTPSGTFSKRCADGLIQHSHLLQFDIDPDQNPWLTYENAPHLRDQIFNLAEVAYCALSASGTGVWGIVPITHPERHKDHFRALQAHFKKWGIVLDNACSNVDRLRFYSYDPNARFRDAPQPFTLLSPEPTARETYAAPKGDHGQRQGGGDWAKVESIVLQVEATRYDFAPDHESWFSVGCALANAFGEAGRDFYHRVCQFSPKYTNRKTDTQFDACLRKDKGYNLATFFHFAKQSGFDWKTTGGTIGAPPKWKQPREPEHAPSAARETPQPPVAPVAPPQTLPPGYKIETYGETKVLINGDGYPANWDKMTDAERTRLHAANEAAPSLPLLCAKLGLKFEGVAPITDESEKERRASQERGAAILRRGNKSIPDYFLKKQCLKKALKTTIKNNN